MSCRSMMTSLRAIQSISSTGLRGYRRVHKWSRLFSSLSMRSSTLSRFPMGACGSSSSAQVSQHCQNAMTPPIRTLFGQSFEVRRIQGIRRTAEDTGTNASKKARSAGLLPGRLYGIDADGRKHHINLWVRYEDLKKEYNDKRECFENTLYDLEIDDVTYRVLPRDLKKHPTRRQALSCDWLIYVPGRNPGYRVSIPTQSINEERCVAYKQGGWLLDIMYKVPVYVFGDRIPDKVMLDLRGKRLGDKIHMSEVHLPDGVTPRHTDNDFAIAKLVGSKRLAKSK